MDFNKLNAMIDELNRNFDIVEQNTKRIEEENLNAKKELFYSTLEYFRNWSELFYKCGGGDIVIKASEDSNHPIRLQMCYSRCGDIYFGEKGSTIGFTLHNHNPLWADKHFFPTCAFRNEVIPTIRSIDYNYVERILSEELNKAITKKAEQIEANYNKAMQDA